MQGMLSDLDSSATRREHHRGEIITTDMFNSGAERQMDPDGQSILLNSYWEILKMKSKFLEHFF